MASTISPVSYTHLDVYKRQVDIPVTQGQLQVRRDFSAPLACLAILFCRLHCFLDTGQGFLVTLWNDTGNGIFLITAIDCLRLPDCLLYTSPQSFRYSSILLCASFCIRYFCFSTYPSASRIAALSGIVEILLVLSLIHI